RSRASGYRSVRVGPARSLTNRASPSYIYLGTVSLLEAPGPWAAYVRIAIGADRRRRDDRRAGREPLVSRRRSHTQLCKGLDELPTCLQARGGAGGPLDTVPG